LELDELKRLLKISAAPILNREVLPSPIPGAPPATEFDVARDALAGMSTIRIADREFRLPGMTRHVDIILKALADFKTKKQRNYQPLPYAKADDICMEPLRPENFSITTPFASAKDNWRQAGIVVGITNILPDNAQVAAGDIVFTLNDDELFIFTDWIEFQGTPRLSAIQGIIDGTTFNPEEMRNDVMYSDLQMHEMNYPWIADVNIIITAKCEFAGTAELVPFGVHICKGRLLAGLT
jgi:hypothetical protein